MELTYAIKDVEHAFRLLEFSIRVMNFFELEKVDLVLFGQDTSILLEEGNVFFNDSYFVSSDNATVTSRIGCSVAFGASAMALDDLFEATGRTRAPLSSEEFYQLWSVIYAVRNAFAHGIAKPTWCIKEQYRREFEIVIEGKKVTIDLAALNGVAFEYKQLGGFHNWCCIKKRVLELIAPLVGVTQQ